jgi:hypothetical protein
LKSWWFLSGFCWQKVAANKEATEPMSYRKTLHRKQKIEQHESH